MLGLVMSQPREKGGIDAAHGQRRWLAEVRLVVSLHVMEGAVNREVHNSYPNAIQGGAEYAQVQTLPSVQTTP